MPAKKHPLILTDDQRERLEVVARSYRHSARERQRAQILLLTDEAREGGSLLDTQIAQQVGCQEFTVGRVRARAAQRGVVESLAHKEQANRKARRLDGAAEAQLIALACSQTPEGRKRWTLRLLKERLIDLGVVESIDEATICRTLKKTSSNPG